MNNASGWIMPRKRASNYGPLTLMARPFSSLLDDLFDGALEPVFSEKTGFTPRIEITEDDNRFLVKAEVPGIKEEDIDVTLRKKALTIKGERKEERERKEGESYRSEWSYGSFERTIPLSFEVEEDKVEASFKDGILSIELPKSKKSIAEAKKVTIKRS